MVYTVRRIVQPVIIGKSKHGVFLDYKSYTYRAVVQGEKSFSMLADAIKCYRSTPAGADAPQGRVSNVVTVHLLAVYEGGNEVLLSVKKTPHRVIVALWDEANS